MNFVRRILLLRHGQLRLATLLRSDMTACITCVHRISFSSNGLNMDDIVKANQRNKSLQELGKMKKSSSIKSSKPSTSNKKSPETDLNSEDKPSIIYPEWFNVILESPFTPDIQINEGQHSEFKEFVEELELPVIPSVTSIIKETQSQSQARVLDFWQAKMTRELGSAEKFKTYRQELIERGLSMHDCIHAQLAGRGEVAVSAGTQGHWESVGHVLPDVSAVVAAEEECVHMEMFYRGKADCVATYKDTVCLIEWKTSSKPKPLLSSTYDNPLQVAAYIGAINRSRMLARRGVPSLTTGLLVIAYGDGQPATVHLMKPKVVERYWRKWTQRLYQFWTFKYRQTLKHGQNI